MYRARRINVVGNSGSGKSTLARAIAARLDCPYVELDELHWKPNWTESTDDELYPKLEAALLGESWVLDGNYKRTVPIKWRRVDMVVWLDLPYWLITWQVVSRTLRRSIRREELWAGNRESLKKAFLERDSIILWSLTHLASTRRQYEAAMANPKYAHIEFVRLRSRTEVNDFLDEIEQA